MRVCGEGSALGELEGCYVRLRGRLGGSEEQQALFGRSGE